jgi:hypothetical protein
MGGAGKKPRFFQLLVLLPLFLLILGLIIFSLVFTAMHKNVPEEIVNI